MVRVLIVDDEESFRRAMTEVVAETEGFVVVGSAASGPEVPGVAATTRPDLVLMDVNLPGFDGFEATRQLRSVEKLGPIVVLLSTYAEGDVDYASCGAAGYITKGAFGPDRLAEAWAAVRRDPALDADRE
jgi:DNA-binding NarL/FixJ family response regulator